MFRVFASFFSCQRSSALGTAQGVPRPAERSKHFRTENKKPGVERRANPPVNKLKRLRAMLDSRLSAIRNWPHFEPREGSIETRYPLTLSSGRTAGKYNIFSNCVKRPLGSFKIC